MGRRALGIVKSIKNIWFNHRAAFFLCSHETGLGIWLERREQFAMRLEIGSKAHLENILESLQQERQARVACLVQMLEASSNEAEVEAALEAVEKINVSITNAARHLSESYPEYYQ